MPVNVDFGQGLDTKTDPTQVAPGKFLTLQNGIFTHAGQLNKRNGFARLTVLPNKLQTNLTTLNNNLIALGTELQTYSADTMTWIDSGIVQPIDLQVTPLVRTSTSQKQPDAALSSTGLVCTVYADTSIAYYQVNDSVTSQQIIAQTALEAGATDARVTVLGAYFVITYKVSVAGNIHLRFITVPTSNPTNVGTPADLAVSLSSINAAYDVLVSGNNLYYGYDSGLGPSVRIGYISTTLVVGAQQTIAGKTAAQISLAATASVVALSFYQLSDTTIYTCTFTNTVAPLLAAAAVTATVACARLTSAYVGTTLNVIYEVQGAYGYDGSISTDLVVYKTVSPTGTVGAQTLVARGTGLASKAFLNSDGIIYLLLFYGQKFQPSYFLVNLAGNVLCRLAYANGITYADATTYLPSVSLAGSVATIPYLIKDLLVSVNKTQGATNVAGIYSQTGINIAKFTINGVTQYSSDIASSLHLTGGQLWQYDSVKPVELGFHVWPEDVEVTTSGAGGLLTAQQYYYKFCYEWTDAKGNLHRSAPSLPVGIVTTGATSSNTINVPTLRLTYKTGRNPVRIVGYRWSVGQQSYFQFTSIAAPSINDPTVDSITIVDTLADSAIIGNTLLYTTGGVLENIAAPASSAQTLYKSRLFLVDAEDRNTIWFSKLVLQGTPVEMTDLQTIYVAPTTGAQGSTGVVTALAAMDDKLIIFKPDAIYYVTGAGPDATGNNNDFSDPVFITGAVGCTNPSSITLTPQGLMFQSNKGIWLLGRNMATSYVGADVEAYNTDTVNSALAIPGTNQVRFGLASGTMLMYDYYYRQWGTFNGISSLSACLYNSKHTTLNALGIVQQESTGYIDDTSPVLLSFTTAWIKFTGLQGYQRAYYMYMLSNYRTPHTLAVNISYDYQSSPRQTAIIVPTNFSPLYGADSLYGSGNPYGGSDNVEQWRIFFNQQKCQSLQINIVESYDPSKGAAAGGGLSFSGLNFVIGAKKPYAVLAPKQSVS